MQCIKQWRKLDIYYYLNILNEVSILMAFTLIEREENLSQGKKTAKDKLGF